MHLLLRIEAIAFPTFKYWKCKASTSTVDFMGLAQQGRLRAP